MMHADPPEHTRYRKLARPGFTNAGRARARGARARAHRRRPRRAGRQGGGRRGRRRHRRAGRPAPDPAHRPAARPARGRRGAAVPLVGGRHPRRHRLVRGRAHGAARRDDRRAPRPGRGPAGRSRATTSCRCSPPTRRTASRSPTTSSGMFLIQLLVAGNETTRNAISGALVALAEHPEQLDRLAADPVAAPHRGRGGAALDHPGHLVHAHRRRRHRARRHRRSRPATRCS